jgi:hypothetical protein
MINRAPASGPPLVVDEDYSALVTEACDALAAPQDWTIDASEGVGSTAIVVRHDLVELPPQGWKLHVTSDVASSALVLSRVLPVLLEGNATFKVIRTPAALARLNGGLHGLSQIGKFITVYPVDDRQAVDLATALDVATRIVRFARAAWSTIATVVSGTSSSTGQAGTASLPSGHPTVGSCPTCACCATTDRPGPSTPSSRLASVALRVHERRSLGGAISWSRRSTRRRNAPCTWRSTSGNRDAAS